MDAKLDENSPGGSTPGQYELEVVTKTGVVSIECGEVIDGLDLNFNMGEAFKAIWRLDKKNTPEYNLNKIIWFAMREKLRRKIITTPKFWGFAKKI